MALTVILALFKLCIEDTDALRDLRLMTYDRQHAQLPNRADAVVIADITDIPMAPGSDGRPCVSRKQLLEVLRALLECHPAAIGIDIDFSPDESGYVDKQHDPAFFDLCLAMRRAVSSKPAIPVYIGVYRSRSGQPDQWLSRSKYDSLAADLMVPITDNRLMPDWYRVAGMTRSLPGLGAVLGRAYLRQHPAEIDRSTFRYPPWFATTEVQRKNERATLTEFLVDFNPAEFLANIGRVEVADRSAVMSNRHRFADKIVIIGKANVDQVQENSFVPPGSRTAYPGVYFHACAAETVAEHPVYQLTPAGQVLVDIGLSSLVFGVMLSTLLYYGRRTQEEVNVRRLHIAMTVVALVVCYAMGVACISDTSIIWDDYLLVMMALIFHPFMEPFGHWIARQWRSFLIPARKEISHG